ncbi:hypothetical protein PR048_030468 [Dryococelus australis]|uniref:DDE-1 domain-containing protein n=1 Tax=Dryococelus australis TaxID=614101 RepID=A0ABQ9G923_9NEOP|nr:hypothetical protein PR048_030468 [Dryococelus australis]
MPVTPHDRWLGPVPLECRLPAYRRLEVRMYLALVKYDGLVERERGCHGRKTCLGCTVQRCIFVVQFAGSHTADKSSTKLKKHPSLNNSSKVHAARLEHCMPVQSLALGDGALDVSRRKPQMPRSKKNIKRVKQDPMTVAAAANLVLKENELRKAALEMKISKSTLSRHFSLHTQSGNRTFTYQKIICRNFSDEEENLLSDYLEQACSMHYGLSQMQFRCLALEFAQANKIKFLAQWDRGMAWLESNGIMNPSFSLRNQQATSLSRSTSLNVMNKGKCSLPTVFSTQDKTGLKTVHNTRTGDLSKRCLSWKHDERGTNVTMIAVVNATGNSIPPAFALLRVYFKDNIMKGAPPGSFETAHVSGWSNCEIFIKFLHHFIEHVETYVDRKVIIVLDNHRSHVSVQCLQLCKEPGIVLLTFPPHTSK